MRKTTSSLGAAPLLFLAFSHAHAGKFPTMDLSDDPRTRKVKISDFTIHDGGQRVTTKLWGLVANGVVEDLKTGRFDRVLLTSRALGDANESDCVSLPFNDTEDSPRLSKKVNWNTSVSVQLSNLDPDFTEQARQANCFYIAKEPFLNSL